MDERLNEIYAMLQNHDQADRAIQAIAILSDEATADWLPVLHEWMSRPEDSFVREAAA